LVLRYSQTPGVGLSCGESTGDHGGIEPPTGAVVTPGASLDLGQGTLSLEFHSGAETRVDSARGLELLQSGAIEISSLGLEVRAERTAHLRAFIPVQAQPAQGANDLSRVLGGGAVGISIVDA